MFTVHFYEEKTLLLSQLLNRVPLVGENLKIKGRKGNVLGVNKIDEKTYHVQVVQEKIKKVKVIEDLSKKKRR
ncbi:MAG TPA: hypothetical protein GX497_16490 [Bacillus bacterium]|nr:hypothetical protein [Bacillus sp. (in: firmicutes)]